MSENNSTNNSSKGSNFKSFILLTVLVLSIVFMILLYFNPQVGSFVKETRKITEGNKTTIITTLVKIDKDSNNTKSTSYLRDNTQIYYGLFFLMFLTIVVYFNSNKCKDIEDG